MERQWLKTEDKSGNDKADLKNNFKQDSNLVGKAVILENFEQIQLHFPNTGIKGTVTKRTVCFFFFLSWSCLNKDKSLIFMYGQNDEDK